MKIFINGELKEVAANSLRVLLDDQGFQDMIIATAVNGEFVPAPDREEHKLEEGDRIEILMPMKGG